MASMSSKELHEQLKRIYGFNHQTQEADPKQ